MHPSALIYLQGDSQAQKLAVAWPRAFEGGGTEDDVFARWAAASGLALPLVRRVGPVLRAHGICRDDGTTDSLAEQYIAAQVQASIRRPKR